MERLTPSEIESIARDMAEKLTSSWNNGSGQQFAEAFTEDAVFVNVYGEILRSKIAIAKGHQFILEQAFKNVKNNYELIDAVQIDGRTILSHNEGTMPGRDGSLTMTLVIVQQGGQWLIRALHNTLITLNPFTSS